MENGLYIVATPIGNLADLSCRAKDILESADYIACEDTRVTKILLDKYNISTKVFDCHKFNEKEKSVKILSLIKEGKKVAFVSDAGTPLISDPGNILIEEMYKNNVKVTSIPGACAVSVFLSLIPRQIEDYVFIGFIARNFKQQKEILDKYKYINCVFFESPNRLRETLKNILEIYGADTKIAVGRELTKIHEEVKIGTVSEILAYYDNNPLKGEIVVMLYANVQEKMNNEEIKEKISILKAEGYSPKDISKIISKLYDLNKNSVYKLAIS